MTLRWFLRYAIPAALAILVGAVLVALPILNSHIEQRVTRYLRAAGADSLRLGSVKARSLGQAGVTIDSLRAVFSRGESRAAYDIHDIRIRYDMWSMIAVARNLDTTRHTHHRDTLRDRLSTLVARMTDAGLPRALQSLEMGRVDITVTAGDTITAQARGLTLHAGARRGGSWDLAVTAACSTAAYTGLCSIDRIRASGEVRGDSLLVETLTGSVCDGTLSAQARLHTASRRIDTAQVTVTQVDLTRLYAYTRMRGEVHGVADCRLTLVDSPLRIDSLRGTAVAEAAGVSVAATPLQRMLSLVLRAQSLTNVHFDTLAARFTLRPDTVYNDTVYAAGTPLRFGARGWTRLNGRIRQEVDGALDAETVAGLPKLVRLTLINMPDGSGRFLCAVRGSYAVPVVSLEKGMFKRAVEGAFESVRDDLLKPLR